MSSGKKDFSLYRFIVLIVLIWILGFAFFVSETKQMIMDKKAGNWPASAHAAVLTGGEGRVEAGINLLKKGEVKQLFISGVGNGVTIKDLLLANKMQVKQEIIERIKLGYSATSTKGNADEIAGYITKNNLQNIIIITSAYHMPRALLELEKYLDRRDVYLHNVTNKNVMNSPLKYLGEYNKYLLAQLTHLFN